MDPTMSMWNDWADLAFQKWAPSFLSYLPQVSLPKPNSLSQDIFDGIETFDGHGPWDRTSIEVEIECSKTGENEARRKVLNFSNSDYLGLSSHPSIKLAIAKATMLYGMGPRASPMSTGHTNYHRLLESKLSNMTKKGECLITSSGYAANLSFLSALGSIASLLASGEKPSKSERIAIFSDVKNHACTIDGLGLLERYQQVHVKVFKHNDITHLDSLLSSCAAQRKVVITDSLFSMDGDYTPLLELVELRRKHGFLLVIDDAHGLGVYGQDGGGIVTMHGVENEVDIIIGSLCKGLGSVGGFVACSKQWKQLMQTRGRAYLFSTSPPVANVIGSLVAVEVAKKEQWRKERVWDNIKYLSTLIPQFASTSPIFSIVLGSEESTMFASEYLLKLGFLVSAIRPPAVPPNACRLRATLTAALTKEDIENFAAALSKCLDLIKTKQDVKAVTSISKL